jgi:hypothetical protein
MRKLFSFSIYVVAFLFCLNVMGQRTKLSKSIQLSSIDAISKKFFLESLKNRSKSIKLSSRAVISDKNSLEDINKLFEDINKKIESEIKADKSMTFYGYSKPKFNIINQKELEIIVELGTKDELSIFDYNGGGLETLYFKPIKFSNQDELKKKLEIVKRDNINRLKSVDLLNIIQEDPPIFKLIPSQVNGPVEIFSTPQTESINLSDLFPYRSISNLEENTLIYNVGLLQKKPDLKQDVWKNLIAEYKKETFKRTKYDAILSHLNPSEKLYIQKIDKMDSDPYRKVYKVCGQGVSKCKWCGKNYVSEKRFKSTISLFRSFLNISRFQYDDNDLLIIVKELRIYINQIKSGNYYYCEGEESGFCSKKCEFEFR